MRMGKRGRFTLIVNLVIILIIMILACKNIESSVETEKYELSRDISEVQTEITEEMSIGEYECCNSIFVEQVQQELEPITLIYDKEFTEDDKYLLAKIAMAEAESQNIQTKTLVIMSVLNRVESDDFPDSILEVIFQNNGKTYQYSPVMQGGRWWTTEPDEDCYEAVEVVLATEYDYSDGALYFESCAEEENCYSKNLEFLYQSEDLRFYK